MQTEILDELYTLLLSLPTVEAYRELFADLCTHKEIEQMAQRVHAARLLKAGNTYQQVMAETEISSATLSRVSRCLQYGQGYRKYV